MRKKQILWFSFWIFWLVLSFFFLWSWQKENEHITLQMKKVQEQMKKNSKMASLKGLEEIDFEKLKLLNSNVVGWIRLAGTKIDYPVVQGNDNRYYLNHSLDKRWSDGGWIFMDYRVSKDFTSKHTIIYGHSRYDGSLFGTMRNIFDENWQQNLENHLVTIFTPEAKSVWEVFSIYTILKEDYYLQTEFSSLNSLKQWLDQIKQRSIVPFKTKIDTTDQILTLSSCYNTKGIRMVLHAKKVAEFAY